MGYMTDGLTFNTLNGGNAARLKTAAKFAKCRDWTPAQWLMALVGELGEAANILKKVERGDFDLNDPVKKQAVADELADVQIYLDLLAQRLGVDLGRATISKFNEVSKRIGSGVVIDHEGWSDFSPRPTQPAPRSSLPGESEDWVESKARQNSNH